MLNVQLKRKRTFAQSVLFVVFLLSSTLAFAQNRLPVLLQTNLVNHWQASMY